MSRLPPEMPPNRIVRGSGAGCGLLLVLAALLAVLAAAPAAAQLTSATSGACPYEIPIGGGYVSPSPPSPIAGVSRDDAFPVSAQDLDSIFGSLAAVCAGTAAVEAGSIVDGTAFPGSPDTGDVFVVTDDSAAGACDSAAGSALSLCRWNGSAWVALGDGGGGGGGAPTDAEYLVSLANATLTAERVFQSGTNTAFVTGVGTAQVDVPDASTTVKGVVELATDGEASAGLAVQGNDARLSNARTPTAHAASHQDGGADEVDLTGLAGVLATPQLASALDDANNTAIDTLDTPADGEILKYDLAANLARWAPGTAAGFTSFDADYGDETVTSTWDLSGALVELPNSTAPTGTDCDAAGEAGRVHVDTDAPSGEQLYVCEGVAGWVLQGGAGGVEAYDPDRTPTTGLVDAGSDEFIGGLEETWRWGNQGTATESNSMDTSLLVEASGGSGGIRARWLDAPASGSWTLAAKCAIDTGTADSSFAGLLILEDGSEATPTKIHFLEAGRSVSNNMRPLHQTWTSYTAFGSTVNSFPELAVNKTTDAESNYPSWLYVRLTYDASASTLTSHVSRTGYDWSTGTAATSVSQPVSVGRGVRATTGASSRMRCAWFRTFDSITAEVGE